MDDKEVIRKLESFIRNRGRSNIITKSELESLVKEIKEEIESEEKDGTDN